MKLGRVWPLGLAFKWGQGGKVLRYGGDLYLLRFKMATLHAGGVTFILMPRIGAMGMQERRIKGTYMNSKHKVREKANSVGYYYMEKVSVSVLMNIGYRP